MGLINLKPTPMVLKLAEQSTVRPVGKLEDVIIYVDSWEYLVDLLVLHTQSLVGGYPFILGRPWLATNDAYVWFQSRNMVKSNGEIMKNLVLYPPVKPSSSVKPGLP